MIIERQDKLAPIQQAHDSKPIGIHPTLNPYL